MLSLPTFRELFEYNYWARDRQLQTCESLTPEQFLKPAGSSYSSVRDTLAHLIYAEWIWLERWNGYSPTRQDAEAYGAEKFPTLASIRDGWSPIEKGVREFLQACPEEKLAQSLVYTNTQGQQWTYPLWRVLFHVINHQSYHRGQVTTLLRQHGLKPSSLDYLLAFDVGALTNH